MTKFEDEAARLRADHDLAARLLDIEKQSIAAVSSHAGFRRRVASRDNNPALHRQVDHLSQALDRHYEQRDAAQKRLGDNIDESAAHLAGNHDKYIEMAQEGMKTKDEIDAAAFSAAEAIVNLEYQKIQGQEPPPPLSPAGS